MARTPKLSRTTVNGITYWCTRAGGKRTYFGNVKEVSKKDAERAFLKHRQELLDKPTVSFAQISVCQLVQEYLEWAMTALSANNCATKKSCLSQWANHRVGASGQDRAKALHGNGKVIGQLAASQITAGHLADFIEARKLEPARPGMSPDRIEKIKAALAVDDRPGKLNVNSAKHSDLMKIEGVGTRLAQRIIQGRPFDSLVQVERAIAGEGKPVGATILSALTVHIKACWNWASKNDVLPALCQPFAHVAKVKIPKKPKLESELPTEDEYLALLHWADYDLGRIRGEDGRYRQRQPHECRQGADNPYLGFSDMLRCYYAMGARTSELAEITVRDVDLKRKQIVLGKHKRSQTSTDGRPRVLTLNEETLEIFKRHCRGRSSSDRVFVQDNGSAWNHDRLNERFAKVRKLAKVRDEITIYSFRHLWISDALESGVAHAEVADMAGTSISQIEETYGHIRSEAKSQSQALVTAHRAAKRAG